MADHSASGGHGATLEAVDGTSHATVQRFRLRGVEGVAAGQVIESTTDRCTIGTHASCDLVLDDPTVSRFHCEIRIGAGGARIVDLGSRNGTVVDTVRVRDADLRPGQVVRVGRAGLRFEDALATNRVARSERVRLGDLVGASPAMRATYALLERAAAASMTVLLEGETGTGKTLAAYEIHRHGARADGPFVTVDAGAIPATLLESELFGHERGAFTGADALRRGAFEEAAGGTLLLDEVGELPLELQTKLLRFLEHREVRRVGGSRVIPVDVRVVAATHRDLRVAVNEGRFRADLYYRLAVVTIRIPPLRERRDDLPAIVDELLAGIGATAAEAELVRGPEALAALTTAAWPGNVRELRNYIQRCIFHGRPLPIEDPLGGGDRATTAGAASEAALLDLELDEARRQIVAAFDRRYLAALVARHGGNVATAATAAGVHRVSLHRLLREYGLAHLTTRARR